MKTYYKNLVNRILHKVQYSLIPYKNEYFLTASKRKVLIFIVTFINLLLAILQKVVFWKYFCKNTELFSAYRRKKIVLAVASLLISCSTDTNTAYIRAEKTNTKQAYADFIKNNPQAPQVLKAKIQIEKIDGVLPPPSPYKWSTENNMDIVKLENGRFQDKKGGLKQIIEFYNSKVKKDSFVGADNIKIAYHFFPAEGSDKALIIAHGTGENPLRYAEVVYDLINNKLPYHIFLISHRGMGFSQRMLGKNRDWNPNWDVFDSKNNEIKDYKKIYVNEFDDYIKDFTVFVNLIREKHKLTKISALGHSLGGGIITRYVEKNPDSLDKIILSAPMHSIIGLAGADTSDYLSRALISIGDTFSHKEYAAGGGGENFSHFETKHDVNNSLNYGTSSYQRFFLKKLVLQEFPETSLGGMTWGFTDSIYEGVQDIRKDADRIKTKTFILQAEYDDYVHPIGHKIVCDKINKETKGLCNLQIFKDAKHELLLERDLIRNQAMTAIFDYLTK